MTHMAKKLIALIITLFLVSFLAFLAFQIIPGDPTTKLLGTEATPEAVAQLRSQLGLDENVLVQYKIWLCNFLQGDFGTSYSYHLSVRDMIGEKLPTTFVLILLSFALTVVLSIPLGTLCGSIRLKWLEALLAGVNQIFMSIPTFFIGILFCFFFGTLLRIFVPGDFVSWQTDLGAFFTYLFFPALAIAIPRIAMTVKMLRTAILGELQQDYVRTARSRGAGYGQILLGHVLKNALLPAITFLAVSAAEIMTNTIIIEQVFTIPGIGRLLIASISNRDFPVVQAIVVIMAAWIVVVNFLADLVAQAVDPRLTRR